MAQKRASFMTYGNDERSEAIRQFIEEAGVQLDIRDWKKSPPTVAELRKLLGHIPIKHFLNPTSPSYAKKKLDEAIPSREEVLAMIVEDPSLLRRPMVKTSRLLTVGYDKKKISEMLQLDASDANTVGEGPREQPRRSSGNHHSKAASATR